MIPSMTLPIRRKIDNLCKAMECGAFSTAPLDRPPAPLFSLLPFFLCCKPTKPNFTPQWTVLVVEFEIFWTTDFGGPISWSS